MNGSLEFIDNSIEVLDVASNYGITTTQQLSAFLMCAKHEGYSLYHMMGLDSDDPKYLKRYAAIRKLMAGDPKRNYDGLWLLQWGDTVYRRERAVLLTPKGEKLFKEIQAAFA